VRHLTTSIGNSASPPVGRSPPRAIGDALPLRQSGFTLTELMIVIVIATILTVIGVPSFRYVTTSNRMSTEMNSLLLDLQYARSEAAREGQYVTVCLAQSIAAQTCATAGTAWQNGWIVFSDVDDDQTIHAGIDAVLRTQAAFSSTDTFVSSGNPWITFNRDGFASTGINTVWITLHDSTNNPSYTRCLKITQAGMMTTETHNTDPTNCQ
jgi:type IV fimbrial biogenesis protein FimT